LSSVLLDTHVLHWWSAEPSRVSHKAADAIEKSDELLVASVSWFELAWLAKHERIVTTVPVLSWLHSLSEQVNTVGITPAIADIATSLPASFPGDPADRIIYATAIECGCKLLSKDKRMRLHRSPKQVVLW
jgi:PIN domain nuclease of toxin-antitoxin system